MARSVTVMRRAGAEEKTFDSLYSEFELHNKIKNLSESTIIFYQWNLKPFHRFLEENGINYIREIQRETIDNFILRLRNIYENATTINTYLRATRAFLYFAMDKNYIHRFAINLVKQERKIKDTYSEADIQKLIAKPNLKTCPFSEYRNWVMVQYLLDTGNRLNTVINIKVKDVNLVHGMVTLTTTKNRKQMQIPISKPLVKVLMEYIKEWSLEPEDYLFPNNEKKQLTKDSIQKTIKRYNEARGVKITSIHAFRHTFAKNFVVTGGNAFKLQQHLGHSSLTVTQNYVALYGNDLQ